MDQVEPVDELRSDNSCPDAPFKVPALLISIVGKGAHGLSEDTKRTARVIAAYISEQLAARGYLPAGKKPGKAKRPGEI